MKALLFVLLPCVVVCYNQVSVEVYYSTASQASVKFIKEQLTPTYMEFNVRYPTPRSRLAVKLIPYGTSFTQQVVNGTDVLTCVGAPLGCYADKVHACAIDLFKDEWKSLGFASCFNKDTGYLWQCARPVCADSTWMFSCVNTVDGDQLLIEHGKTTQKLNVTLTDQSLPVVTFDGQYNKDEQQQAKENFLSLLCQKLEPPPAVCTTPRAHHTMTHNNFGTNRVYPMELLCKKQLHKVQPDNNDI